ncbi:MAG: hypothetical protein ACTS5P_00065 [Candidatus Hodgkinia cicadicola]
MTFRFFDWGDAVASLPSRGRGDIFSNPFPIWLKLRLTAFRCRSLSRKIGGRSGRLQSSVIIVCNKTFAVVAPPPTTHSF